MQPLPLISCLTVTSNRLVMLKEAIGCYVAQTYANREMVIAAAGSDRYYEAIADYLEHLGRSDIRVIRADPDAPLGTMRNQTTAFARGAYICQWDDDDLYHPERLRMQYEAMSSAGADACFLTDLLQFYADELSLYWLDWSLYSLRGSDQAMLPGSMLARRDPRLRYPEAGQEARRGEDNVFRSQVFAHLRPVALSGHGYLYVYRYHGRNVFDRRHYMNFTMSAMNSSLIRARLDELRHALAALPLPLPYTVRDRNGETVFLYNGPAAICP